MKEHPWFGQVNWQELAHKRKEVAGKLLVKNAKAEACDLLLSKCECVRIEEGDPDCKPARDFSFEMQKAELEACVQGRESEEKGPGEVSETDDSQSASGGEDAADAEDE